MCSIPIYITETEAQPPPFCNPYQSLLGNTSDCINERTNETSRCFQECYDGYCVVEQDKEECKKACAGCCLNDDADGDCNPYEVDNCPDDYNLTQIDTDSDVIGDACDSDIVTSSLAGTRWDVFVLQFPFCQNECGGAIVSFYEGGEADISWNNPNIERLPFPYQELISLGDLVFFKVYDSHETFLHFGWGSAMLDLQMHISLFSFSPGYCGLNYIIFGVPYEN
jgi:hypothetical protein